MQSPKYQQLVLPNLSSGQAAEKPGAPGRRTNGQANGLDPQDRAFHDWYRFVLSYPPHLVRQYLEDFGLSGETTTVLDPFCGTGTTVVEAKKVGVRAIGVEAHPFSAFAGSVKLDWGVDPDALAAAAASIASEVRAWFEQQGLDDFSAGALDAQSADLRQLEPEREKLLITNSISPLPLHKVLVLLEAIQVHRQERYFNHCLLALANALVFQISNLKFGPEVGVGQIKRDAPVIAPWLAEIEKMSKDLRQFAGQAHPFAHVYHADSRDIASIIPAESIDAVITSPPYPNEKDYTRTTRLESVILGFVPDKQALRALKRSLVRSNTRGVYVDDRDDEQVYEHPEIQAIAEAIEKRRIELGKTSGFEKQYARVTKLYFGGMARHLAELRKILRPGAQLAYVVGDQASYLQVFIPTGKLLADIAVDLGYELVRIDLFRTRFATATKQQLREEVVVLRWPK